MMSLMVKTDDNAHPAVISSQAEGQKKREPHMLHDLFSLVLHRSIGYDDDALA